MDNMQRWTCDPPPPPGVLSQGLQLLEAILWIKLLGDPLWVPSLPGGLDAGPRAPRRRRPGQPSPQDPKSQGVRRRRDIPKQLVTLRVLVLMFVTAVEQERGRSRTKRQRQQQQEPTFKNTDVRLRRTAMEEPDKAQCPPDQGPIGKKPGTRRLPELSRRSQNISLTRWLGKSGRSESREQREQEEPKVVTGIGTNVQGSGGLNEQGSQKGSKERD